MNSVVDRPNVDHHHRHHHHESTFQAAGLPLRPPGLPPQLWAAATSGPRTPAAPKNPALPYHTAGPAITRPPKSTSLPGDRAGGRYPRSPASVSSSGSGPAAAMSFFAR